MGVAHRLTAGGESGARDRRIGQGADPTSGPAGSVGEATVLRPACGRAPAMPAGASGRYVYFETALVLAIGHNYILVETTWPSTNGVGGFSTLFN